MKAAEATTECLKPPQRVRSTMPGAPAASPTRLGDLAHDLRSALAATAAYVDLARERLAEGSAVEDEDLARIERGLASLAKAVERVEAAAKAPVPREGPP
jgi:hypothetical protein